MVSVAALLLAKQVRPDGNDNFDVIGALDTFRIGLPASVTGADAIDDLVRRAGDGYGGEPGILVYWRIPASDRDRVWEGKLEVWSGDRRLRDLGGASIDTRAHGAKWLVSLDRAPLYTPGEHELRAYCRPVTEPPTAWPSEPAGVYPYMVIVQPIPGRTGKAGTTPATTAQGTPTPTG